MNEPLEQLFEAADNHAEDSGEMDHTVGDLQDLLREAWALMHPSQKLALLDGDAAENIIDAGAREEFDADDLVAQVEAEVAEMNTAVAGAGYAFLEGEYGFSWSNLTEDSGYFVTREDAVADAFKHFKSPSAA